MSDKKKKLREILKKYGVTKCYISPDFDFNADEPNGDIVTNIRSTEMDLEIFKLFTLDPDGLCSDEQSLGVWYNDFIDDDLVSNYLEVL